MKLVRFIADGRTAVGALTADAAHVVDLARAGAFSPSMSALLERGEEGLAAARAAMAEAPASAKYPLAGVKLLAPVGDPGKIMCIGQNYRDHCEEQNQPIPERAILFSKYATALNDPNADVRLLAITPQIDYEAELAVVIGKKGRSIAEADAMQYVGGYMCANDVTARDIQKGDGQWVRGKTRTASSRQVRGWSLRMRSATRTIWTFRSRSTARRCRNRTR